MCGGGGGGGGKRGSMQSMVTVPLCEYGIYMGDSQ